jgi:hypothetical protein
MAQQRDLEDSTSNSKELSGQGLTNESLILEPRINKLSIS